MAQLAKGDIPTLILAVLADKGPRHGYAIAREIEKGHETFRLREGSLYPALRTLEQEGFIAGEWEIPTSGQSGPARKVYTITGEGTTELARRRQGWKIYVDAINTVLKGPDPVLEGPGNGGSGNGG